MGKCDHGWHDEIDCDICRPSRDHVAELEALLREVDAKVVFETAVTDGTGNDLQQRIEQALGFGDKSAFGPSGRARPRRKAK